jgi:hypothetical protein
MIEKPEVAASVKSQLLSRTEYYDLYGQLDDLSGGARIEDIKIIDIGYENRVSGRIDFFGTLQVEAVKEVGITRSSFTGVFEGYFDEIDIYLESASLDVSSTIGEDSYDGKPNSE